MTSLDDTYWPSHLPHLTILVSYFAVALFYFIMPNNGIIDSLTFLDKSLNLRSRLITMSDNSCVWSYQRPHISCASSHTIVGKLSKHDCIVPLPSNRSYYYEKIGIQTPIRPQSSSLFHTHPASNGITLFSLNKI